MLPHPLFDTQVAAALLGHTQQIGYAALVHAECGVTLKKIDSFTDWSRRPLSDSQLEYAADDVVYLPRMYERMRAQLVELGRLSWLDRDFEDLADPARYAANERERYKRLKRVSQLSRRQLSAAREVAAWRELEAQRRDVPRKWVVTDEQIVEACKREPRSIDDLFMVRGLSDRLSTKDARTVVWRMDELAANAPQTAVLRIVALHTGEGNGNLALNEAATLTADGGVSMQFAPLTVYVDCGEPAGEIWPEPCVPAACVCTSAGGGVVTADVGTVSMAGTGGLLMINARLKNVCPGRRILLGVWVTRETPDGCQMCGFKSYVLQPNTGTAARDIAVKGLRFLLPPQADGCGCGCGDSQCYQVYAAAQAMDEGACPCIPQNL